MPPWPARIHSDSEEHRLRRAPEAAGFAHVQVFQQGLQGLYPVVHRFVFEAVGAAGFHGHRDNAFFHGGGARSMPSPGGLCSTVMPPKCLAKATTSGLSRSARSCGWLIRFCEPVCRSTR